MRLIAIVALALLLVQRGTTDEIAADDHGLELRYELIDVKNPDVKQAATEFPLHVEIVNRGPKNVVIPTKRLGPLTLWNGQTAHVLFQPLIPTKTRDGLRIVTPMADLAPVELRPGEVAVLHCDLKINKNTIIGGVDYELSPAFAERYGFWSGKLSARIRRTPEAESGSRAGFPAQPPHHVACASALRGSTTGSQVGPRAASACAAPFAGSVATARGRSARRHHSAAEKHRGANCGAGGVAGGWAAALNWILRNRSQSVARLTLRDTPRIFCGARE